MPETPAETSREALRERLLAQAAYLVDEVEALGAVIDLVPTPVLEGRPLEGDRSIKELFALLAARDRAVHRPRSEGRPPAEPAMPTGEATADDRPVDALLADVRAARTVLVDALRALDAEAWARPDADGADLYRHVHALVQHDAEVLRTIAHRLHESNLSAGPRPPR